MTLRPVFTLTVGALRCTESDPVGGLSRLVVDRDMTGAADAVQVRLADRAGIGLGDPVTVDLGLGDGRERVFTGSVVELTPTRAGAGMRAAGSMLALHDLRVAATYDGQSVGAIARDLVRRAGVPAGTIDEGSTLPAFAVDGRVSGYRHLRGLADRLGHELYTSRDGRVMCHAPGGPGPSAGQRLAYGQQLVAATGQRRGPAPAAVEVGGESPMSSRGAGTAAWLSTDDDAGRGTSGGTSAGGTRTRLVVDPVARTKDLADRFAAGYRAGAGRAAAQLVVIVPGLAGIDLGDLLTVSDPADDLVGGTGYVRALRHHLDGSTGFRSMFRLALEER